MALTRARGGAVLRASRLKEEGRLHSNVVSLLKRNSCAKALAIAREVLSTRLLLFSLSLPWFPHPSSTPPTSTRRRSWVREHARRDGREGRR